MDGNLNSEIRIENKPAVALLSEKCPDVFEKRKVRGESILTHFDGENKQTIIQGNSKWEIKSDDTKLNQEDMPNLSLTFKLNGGFDSNFTSGVINTLTYDEQPIRISITKSEVIDDDVSRFQKLQDEKQQKNNNEIDEKRLEAEKIVSDAVKRSQEIITTAQTTASQIVEDAKSQVQIENALKNNDKIPMQVQDSDQIQKEGNEQIPIQGQDMSDITKNSEGELTQEEKNLKLADELNKEFKFAFYDKTDSKNRPYFIFMKSDFYWNFQKKEFSDGKDPNALKSGLILSQNGLSVVTDHELRDNLQYYDLTKLIDKCVPGSAESIYFTPKSKEPYQSYPANYEFLPKKTAWVDTIEIGNLNLKEMAKNVQEKVLK